MLVSTKENVIYVWLSDGLWKDLNSRLNEHNNKLIKGKKLSLPIAAYFVNLPIYIRSLKKEKYSSGWVPICSDLVKSINQYNKYFNFLTQNGFLEVDNRYSKELHFCKKYRLGEKYKKQVSKCRELKVNNIFYNKRLESVENRKKVAQKSTEHLTKWLDKSYLFEINVEFAEKYIKETYEINQIEERNSRQIVIDKIKNDEMVYSREGKDKRLHSTLTSLPSDLRQFIRFDNSPLVSVDISSSQPFILGAMIHKLIHGGNLIQFTQSNNNYSSSIMFNPKDKRGLEKYVNKVLSGEFYSSLGDFFYKEGVLFSNVNDHYFIGTETKELFSDRRNAAKQAVMRILYSSRDNREQIVLKFEKEYPEVYKILKQLKTSNKSDFPILMQNIEAEFILDYCTKYIAEKYPEMPLFTIHDSIVSTEENIQILEEEFHSHLKNYFTIFPRLKKEYWSECFEDRLQKISA